MTHSNTNPAVCSTLRMHTAISPWQWQPWTAVSSLLGLISMAKPSDPSRCFPREISRGASLGKFSSLVNKKISTFKQIIVIFINFNWPPQYLSCSVMMMWFPRQHHFRDETGGCQGALYPRSPCHVTSILGKRFNYPVRTPRSARLRFSSPWRTLSEFPRKKTPKRN